MESTHLGLVLDSSTLIAAERRNLTADQAIETVKETVGEIPIILSSLTVAEIGHGIYRANTPEIRERRARLSRRAKSHDPNPSFHRRYGEDRRPDRR